MGSLLASLAITGSFNICWTTFYRRIPIKLFGAVEKSCTSATDAVLALLFHLLSIFLA
jgi:hypothetical protein